MTSTFTGLPSNSAISQSRIWKSHAEIEKSVGFRLRLDEYRRLIERVNEIQLFEARKPVLKELLDVFTNEQMLGDMERRSMLREEVDENGISYASGRRKSCECKVWMRPFEGPSENTSWDSAEENNAVVRIAFDTHKTDLPLFVVNGRLLHEYFPDIRHVRYVAEPFEATKTFFKYSVFAQARGSGLSMQAQALRFAVSHALVKQRMRFADALEDAGLLKHDPRRRERKKYGRRKARAKFQWCKR